MAGTKHFRSVAERLSGQRALWSLCIFNKFSIPLPVIDILSDANSGHSNDSSDVKTE